jgi:hypothetical protein
MTPQAAVFTMAHWLALEAVKRELHAQGIKRYALQEAVIRNAARDYLRDHPELIWAAAIREARRRSR